MKTIVAGSRKLCDYDLVTKAIDASGFSISEVVSGCAAGVDTLGERFAKEHSIPIKKMPAQWDVHGKSAGYIRNSEMEKYADALVAVWDGVSSGTKHMIDSAKRGGLKIFVYNHLTDHKE